MLLTKITRNNQITIPKEVMNTHNLKVGDRFRVSTEDGQIILSPVKVVETAKNRKA